MSDKDYCWSELTRKNRASWTTRTSRPPVCASSLTASMTPAGTPATSHRKPCPRPAPTSSTHSSEQHDDDPRPQPATTTGRLEGHPGAPRYAKSAKSRLRLNGSKIRNSAPAAWSARRTSSVPTSCSTSSDFCKQNQPLFPSKPTDRKQITCSQVYSKRSSPKLRPSL
jgi:hypothetical protein